MNLFNVSKTFLLTFYVMAFFQNLAFLNFSNGTFKTTFFLNVSVLGFTYLFKCLFVLSRQGRFIRTLSS